MAQGPRSTVGRSSSPASQANGAPGSGGRLAAFVLGLFLAAIVLEVGLRVLRPIPIRVRGDDILLPRNVVYRIHNGAPSGLAGVLDEDLVHTKNSLGFRGPEPPADFEGALTVVAIGGSTTECFFLGDADAWPAQVGELLSKNFPKIWLNNAGLDGHSTFGHLELMRRYVSRLHPKFVTILAGINDVFANEPNDYDNAPIEGMLSRLSRYSDIVALGMMAWRHERATEIRDLGAMPRPINLHDDIYHQPVAQSAAGGLRSTTALESRVRAYRRRLEELVALSRASGIEPILVTQPALFGPAVDDVTGEDLGRLTTQFTEQQSGAEMWAILERFNDAMREVGRDRSVAVIDLARLMPKSSRYYYDFLHFSKAGSAEVARIVSRQMCPILAGKAPGQLSGACETS